MLRYLAKWNSDYYQHAIKQLVPKFWPIIFGNLWTEAICISSLMLELTNR